MSLNFYRGLFTPPNKEKFFLLMILSSSRELTFCFKQSASYVWKNNRTRLTIRFYTPYQL